MKVAIIAFSIAISPLLFIIGLAAEPLIRPIPNFSLSQPGLGATDLSCKDPPRAPCEYRVRFTNMKILFPHFRYRTTRNATLIDEVLIRDAIREAVVHPRKQLMGIESREWYASVQGPVGDVEWTLAIEPHSKMTWGMWTDALVGLKHFVQEHPGWDFRFMLEPWDRARRIIVGSGGLY